MVANTFYILEHPEHNMFYSYDKENYTFDWHKCLPEDAVKFNSYNDAKDFVNNSTFANRNLEEFLNCKIRKLTITVELSECEE